MTHSHDTATPALSVGSEYVLVPREPSDRMTAIGQKHRYDSAWSIGAIYRAMIAAAPALNPSPAAKSGGARLDFGAAIAALKDGRWARRAGWNGKNMHVYLEDMGMSRMPRADSKGKIAYSDNGKVLPHIVLFNAQGERQPGWNASQADMLAEDWEIVSWEEMR